MPCVPQLSIQLFMVKRLWSFCIGGGKDLIKPQVVDLRRDIGAMAILESSYCQMWSSFQKSLVLTLLQLSSALRGVAVVVFGVVPLIIHTIILS